MKVTLDQEIKIFYDFMHRHKECKVVEEMLAYEILDIIPEIQKEFYQLSIKLDMFPNHKDKSILYKEGIEPLMKKYDLNNRILIDSLYIHYYERKYGEKIY